MTIPTPKTNWSFENNLIVHQIISNIGLEAHDYYYYKETKNFLMKIKTILDAQGIKSEIYDLKQPGSSPMAAILDCGGLFWDGMGGNAIETSCYFLRKHELFKKEELTIEKTEISSEYIPSINVYENNLIEKAQNNNLFKKTDTDKCVYFSLNQKVDKGLFSCFLISFKNLNFDIEQIKVECNKEEGLIKEVNSLKDSQKVSYETVYNKGQSCINGYYSLFEKNEEQLSQEDKRALNTPIFKLFCLKGEEIANQSKDLFSENHNLTIYFHGYSGINQLQIEAKDEYSERKLMELINFNLFSDFMANGNGEFNYYQFTLDKKSLFSNETSKSLFLKGNSNINMMQINQVNQHIDHIVNLLSPKNKELLATIPKKIEEFILKDELEPFMTKTPKSVPRF